MCKKCDEFRKKVEKALIELGFREDDWALECLVEELMQSAFWREVLICEDV